MTHSARLLAFALFSASLGCSAIVDPEASDPLATAEGFCNSIQDALADLPCGGSPDAVEQQYAYLRRHCDTLQAAVSEGRFAYSKGSAEACIDAIERYGCRGVFDAMAMNNFEWPQACRDALRGRVQAGGACTYREWSGGARQTTDSYVLSECVEGTGCYPMPGGDGVCGDACAYPASLGQSCYGDRPCEPGLTCAYNFGYVCQLGTAGDPCYYPSECAGGYYGGYYCTGSPGTCQPAATAGNPCSLGSFCSADSYCSSGTCVARAGPGQNCAWPVQCDLSLTCYNDGLSSTCRYYAQEGQSCAGTYCQSTTDTPLYCDATQVCRRYPAEPLARGADCFSLGTNYCADGLFCDTAGTFGPANTCQPQLGPGADCSTGPSWETCRSGTYCFYDSMASPATSTCRDMPGLGGACDTMAMLPCEGGLTCRTSGGTTGVCDTMPTDGEPCASGGAMMGCAPGHYMDYTSTCVCRRYKGDGQACANDTECGASQTGLRCLGMPATCQLQYACEVPIGWSPTGGP